MNTTVDRDLIAKMIHANCKVHHCQHGKAREAPVQESSLPAPEFLHSGSWPPPPPPIDSSNAKGEPRALPGTGNATTSLEESTGPVPGQGILQAATPENFSRAVEDWKKTVVDPTLAGGVIDAVTAPYAALKLLAKSVAGKESTSRQTFFTQEISAESQARKEIMEYISKLYDAAEYEEAYGCVWPLEEYRRGEWARELMIAFPKEAQDFVDNVKMEDAEL